MLMKLKNELKYMQTKRHCFKPFINLKNLKRAWAKKLLKNIAANVGLVLPKLMARRRNKGGCAAKGLCVYSFFKSQKQGQTFIPSILCNERVEYLRGFALRKLLSNTMLGVCKFLKNSCN